MGLIVVRVELSGIVRGSKKYVLRQDQRGWVMRLGEARRGCLPQHAPVLKATAPALFGRLLESNLDEARARQLCISKATLMASRTTNIILMSVSLIKYIIHR